MSTHAWPSGLVSWHSPVQPLLFGFLAGILLHTGHFIRGYHDTSALRIIVLHLVSFLSLLVFLAAIPALLMSLSYLLSLILSILTYRLLFHPLRRFPGPLFAKLTKLHGPYTARHGQMHLEQNKLLRRYGDVVRIAPNELLILRSDAIQKIHGAKSGCRKRHAGVYDAVHFQGAHNLDSILDREEHRWRRQVWERAMTTKALRGYEDTAREVCRRWLGKVAEVSKTARGKVDTSLYSLLITFENMGRVGFGHEFGSIERGQADGMLKLLESMFGQIARLGELVWPVALMQSLDVGGDAAEFDKLTVKMADEWLEGNPSSSSSGEEGGNGMEEKSGSAISSGEIGAIFGHLAEDWRKDKPLAYFNKNILYADAGVILVGATDTIAVVLSYAFYHLAKHQDYQKKLHEEVAGVFGKTIQGEFTNSDLAGLELLEAVLNETMRLDNPVCNNAARMTPSEGIVLDDGTRIPGGCSVRVPGYALQRSERAFVAPDEFIPERWTSRPDLVLDRAAFMPFLVGPNNCVGKRLAWLVLRLVISSTVYHYRFRFAPGEDGTDIYEKAENHLILTAGPLKVVFDKRDA